MTFVEGVSSVTMRTSSKERMRGDLWFGRGLERSKEMHSGLTAFGGGGYSLVKVLAY